MSLSEIDRKILNSIQEDIPLVPEPFKVLSSELGIDENEFIEHIKKLKEDGIIRTYSAGVNYRNIGYKGSLIAARVTDEELEELADKLVKMEEVTHCYLREGEFNLYFVLICKDQERMDEILEDISNGIGKENILNLVTKKQFKLRNRFKL